MNGHPLISIITPVYNHEQFIRACINSVRAQTYQRWEQIIVDDGSTDRSWEIVQDYAQDQRICGLRQPNLGPARLAETYNTALAHANGEYIAILEGDDYWLPDKLATQVACLTDDTVLSYGAFYDEIAGELRPGRRPPFSGRRNLREFLGMVLAHQSFMLAVTQLIRKDALIAIGGFRQDGSPAAVDMATLLRLAQLPGEVVYIPEPLGVWRHHTTQSTHVRGLELAIFNARLALQCYDSLPETLRNSLMVTRPVITRARRQQVADAYFGALRTALQRREVAQAHMLIAGLWNYGNLKQKIEAVYAYAAMLIGADLEFPLKLATLGQRIYASAGTRNRLHIQE